MLEFCRQLFQANCAGKVAVRHAGSSFCCVLVALVHLDTGHYAKVQQQLLSPLPLAFQSTAQIISAALQLVQTDSVTGLASQGQAQHQQWTPELVSCEVAEQQF